MATNDETTVICANADCAVAEDGRCIEGFELSACPHYGREPEVAPEPDVRNERSSVDLPGAETLSTSDASMLLRRGDARVIAIIGPGDSGKTSLIASLYELFQEGRVSDIGYARSRSLHAFERACHHARAVSRRNTPHIYRTPLGGVSFYHLDLSGGPAGVRLALVLGDRAGEDYLSVADDVSVARTLPEVMRADSITVLVDGERLLNSGDRHNLRSEIVMTLQGLVDGGALGNVGPLALVLTKMDLIRESSMEARVDADFMALENNIRQNFGSVFSRIRVFETAASPKTNKMGRGTGVPALLIFWLESSVPMDTELRTRPVFARAFARVAPIDG